MFCPQCRSEYRPGFDACADCKVLLVEELPASPPPPVPGPEMARWELNRTDSRNIAFVKGALVGMACAQVLGVLYQFVLLQFVVGPSPLGAPMPWRQMVFSLGGMFTPIGIILGGLISRSRMR